MKISKLRYEPRLPFTVSKTICSLEFCPIQSRSQLVDQQLLEPDLRSRDRELTEIAKSIATLAELFKDLSSLVIDQGTLLDSVEYNIEQTAVHMKEAVKELDIATRFVPSRVVLDNDQSLIIFSRLFLVPLLDRYQKNTGKRKCIFLLLLIIFGLVMVLIFKPRRHSAPPAPPPIPTHVAERPPLLDS